MEKLAQEEEEQKLNHNNERANHKKSLVWDCESSLYDSFELKSFKAQLDSAIVSSRTLSMPHLSDRRADPPPPPLPQRPPVSKKASKISRSFHKLLKSVFGSSSKTNNNSTSSLYRAQQERSHDRVYVHDMSHALSTIPEGPEMDYAGLSPELNSFVRKTASERFTATSIGISCA